MRVSAALAGAALAVVACAATAQASALVGIPAGLYTPFQRVKTQTESQDAPAPPRPIGSFRLEAEPVTNAEFLAFDRGRDAHC